MTKNQFTRTAAQPHRNRKFRQIDKDQYCITGKSGVHPGNPEGQPRHSGGNGTNQRGAHTGK